MPVFCSITCTRSPTVPNPRRLLDVEGVARRLIRDLELVAVKTASEVDVVVFGLELSLGLGLTLGDGRLSALVLEDFWAVVVGLGLALGLEFTLGEGRLSPLVLEALEEIVGVATGVEELIVSPSIGFIFSLGDSGCWGLQPVAKSSSAVMSQ